MRTIIPKAATPTTDRRRRRLAAMAERAAVPERPFPGRGPRHLIEPSVSLACGPVLLDIAGDLRDQALPIDGEVLDDIATFLSGPSSRLFERSPDGARDEAVRLARVQRRRRTDARIDPREDEIPSAPVPESHLRGGLQPASTEGA